MRVLLFALTGFGNRVLDQLLEQSCEVIAIFTRKEKGPFPYYPEENITEYSTKKGIRVYEEFDWEQVGVTIKETSPDLLLVATFHRIIPEKIISLIPLAVNIHPSLLPKYRGPTPVEWAIFYKEKETGVTAHLLTERLDAGDILIQKKIPIEKDDADSTLREKLALLSREVIRDLITQIKTGSLKPVPQDEKEATYFPNFRKIAERVTDAGDFPKVVLIDTVNYCNLRCSMCGRRKMTRKGGMMEMALYQKIIDEIAEKDKTVRVWLVFFGDPFMLKDEFYPFVKYAKQKGLTDVVVNTNGNLMDESHAYKLIESGLDAIYIGIDGFTPETYSKLRIGGDLERVKKNVKALIEAKKELGAKNPEVFVQFVEMEENKHEKEEFIKYWKEQGAIVKIRPMISWAGAVEAKNLEAGRSRYPCYWAMRTMNILYDGRVCLCAVDYDGKFIAGDVKTEFLQSVWLKGLKKIRDLQASGQYHLLPPICRDCLDWQAAKAEFSASCT